LTKATKNYHPRCRRGGLEAEILGVSSSFRSLYYKNKKLWVILKIFLSLQKIKVFF
jgi:hypothetical protein